MSELGREEKMTQKKNLTKFYAIQRFSKEVHNVYLYNKQQGYGRKKQPPRKLASPKCKYSRGEQNYLSWKIHNPNIASNNEQKVIECGQFLANN